MLLKGLLRIITGTVLTVIGLVGLIIPLMPGWPIIIIGILLLAPHHKDKIKKWVAKIRNRAR